MVGGRIGSRGEMRKSNDEACGERNEGKNAIGHEGEEVDRERHSRFKTYIILSSITFSYPQCRHSPKHP